MMDILLLRNAEFKSILSYIGKTLSSKVSQTDNQPNKKKKKNTDTHITNIKATGKRKNSYFKDI